MDGRVRNGLWGAHAPSRALFGALAGKISRPLYHSPPTEDDGAAPSSAREAHALPRAARTIRFRGACVVPGTSRPGPALYPFINKRSARVEISPFVCHAALAFSAPLAGAISATA